MKKFSDFGIGRSALAGDKIEMNLVINKEIIVQEARVEKSKFPKAGFEECVWMQIEFEGAKRVLFSGSKVLTEMIKQIQKEDYPFQTTIIKPGKHLQFT